MPTLGLNIPSKFMITDILQAPPPVPLWDIQIVHADPGGLDELERQLEATLTGVGLRPRINRRMASRPVYFDYLKNVLSEIRQLDHLPVPQRLSPITQNLVGFLN
jgi:hypothetical protein